MHAWGEAECSAQTDVENQTNFQDYYEHNAEASLALFRWCRTLEYWYLHLWNLKYPGSKVTDPTPYLGRGMPPTFQTVPIKAEGNKDVLGRIDFGSSETVACRSLLLARRIVFHLLKADPSPFWKRRLKYF